MYKLDKQRLNHFRLTIPKATPFKTLNLQIRKFPKRHSQYAYNMIINAPPNNDLSTQVSVKFPDINNTGVSLLPCFQ